MSHNLCGAEFSYVIVVVPCSWSQEYPISLGHCYSTPQSATPTLVMFLLCLGNSGAIFCNLLAGVGVMHTRFVFGTFQCNYVNSNLFCDAHSSYINSTSSLPFL